MAPSGRSTRVLLVGRRTERYARELGDAGVPAVTATTAEDALDELSGAIDGVDCVVSRRTLPESEGFDLLTDVRDAHPSVPVVVVDDDGVVATRPAESGGDRHLERVTAALAGETATPDGGTGLDDAVVAGYETVVDALGDPIYLLDEDGVLTYVNDATTELLGVPAEEVIGRDISEFLPDDAAEVGDRKVAAMLQEGRTDDTFEMAVVDDDGERIPVENHVALVERDGEFRGTVGVLRDVTERKKRESELKQYETIIHALADPVYATDEDGHFTFVNPTFESFTGYSEAEVVDEPMHFESIVVDEDVERIYDRVEELLTGERSGSRTTLEIETVSRDGRHVPVEDSLALLDAESFDGVAGVLRDVSDQKQQQQRLEVMNRVLRHNVRNQMNVIHGSAETVVEMADDPTVAEIARSILEASDEMTRVSDNVRDLQQAIDREREESIDAVALVETILRDQRERYPDAAMVADLPETMVVDAGRSVGYAIQHLVENAVEHNDGPSQRVEVTVGSAPERDGWARIDVADDGPGIPDQDRKVVTGEVEADPLRHGSGLGLWIVNWIVESHDGEVSIAASEEGTTVSLYLPRA